MKRLHAAALLLTSLTLSLLACEFTVRAWDGMPLWPPRDMIGYRASFLTPQRLSGEYDPLLGWRQRSNTRVPEFDLTTGDLGVRMNSDAESRRPLALGAVVAVGDSFTAGSEVGDAETWPAQLERLVGRPVINAAVGGYGTDQMILRAESLMPVLRPSAVVVGILDDDINRAGYRVYGGAPKPWFELAGGRLIHHNDPVPPPSAADSQRVPRWLAYSYLAVWATERAGYGNIWHSQGFVPAKNDAVAVTCALLERLKRSTDAARVPVYVVMIHGGLDRMGTMDVATEKPAPIAVSACAARLGIATIDLMHDLVDLARNDPAAYRGLYHRYEGRPGVYGHLTVAGNAFVAERIAARMIPDTGHPSAAIRQ
jgi:hypothetical protein